MKVAEDLVDLRGEVNKSTNDYSLNHLLIATVRKLVSG